ncbi:hypothetical protein CFE14_RS16020 [Vibrio parahaemolyticus]|nr:hypothetical protein [Vibrio parahaemolyticus]
MNEQLKVTEYRMHPTMATCAACHIVDRLHENVIFVVDNYSRKKKAVESIAPSLITNNRFNLVTLDGFTSFDFKDLAESKIFVFNDVNIEEALAKIVMGTESDDISIMYHRVLKHEPVNVNLAAHYVPMVKEGD